MILLELSKISPAVADDKENKCSYLKCFLLINEIPQKKVPPFFYSEI